MQVILHPGVYNTGGDRLVNSLRRNDTVLEEAGISVPAPSAYRRLIRDTVQLMERGDAIGDAREQIVDAFCDAPTPPERVILSNENFFCVPKLAISNGALYPKAPRRIALFCELFPAAEVELSLAICDPASFLPAVFATANSSSFLDYMDGTDALDIRWSDLIWRIREAAPDIAITVWCNEDTPLVWGEVLREVAGLDHTVKIEGSDDLLPEIMSKEGLKRFRNYIDEHPDLTEVQRRRVIAAFLDKYALEEAIEEELDLPGWTEDYVERLSAQYEEDTFEIGRIPGVQMITP